MSPSIANPLACIASCPLLALDVRNRPKTARRRRFKAQVALDSLARGSMRNRILLTLCLGGLPFAVAQQPTPLTTQAPVGKWAIVLHGGAGVIERSSMPPEP